MKNRVTVRLYETPAPRNYAAGGLVEAAEAVRGKGRWGDEILIHVNPEEFKQMQGMWGDPTHNPHTGLPEYGFLSKLWKKIKPLVKAVAPLALMGVPGVGPVLAGGLKALGVGAKLLPLATKVATGALGGALGGGSKGALAGALTGGIAGGGGSKLGGLLGLDGRVGQVAGNALLSGGASRAMGGKFGTGALIGGGLTAAMPYANNALANTALGKRMGLVGGMDTLTNAGDPMRGLSEYSVRNGGLRPLDDGGMLGDEYANNGGGPGVGMQSPDAPMAPGGLEEVTVSQPRLPGAWTAPPGAWTSPPGGGGMPGPWLGAYGYPSESGSGAPETAAADPAAADPAAGQNITPGSFLDRAFGLLNNGQGLAALGALASGGPRQAGPPAPPAFTSEPLQQFAFNRTQRPMAEEDFYTYGTRPERSFYDNNGPPVRAAAGGLMTRGYATGGRADDIEARLSEGEYVMDAETVALLGDGSVEAGARKLDQMRQNLRMQKGEALAIGDISAPAAEDPMAYIDAGAPEAMAAADPVLQEPAAMAAPQDTGLAALQSRVREARPPMTGSDDPLLSSAVLNKQSRRKLGKVVADMNMGVA